MSGARTEADRLTALFRAAGGVALETPVLQPAETLLDLYGEDIRARAYVTSDPVLGEQMLRPDFTVPVVQKHMTDGAEPARYTYQGLVFRKQEAGTGRTSEYLQVGYELFERDAPAQADAEVFALFSEALQGLGLRAVTGDIGVLMAAVEGLTTTARRRAALERHIWRPRRFRALLERFSAAPTAARLAQISALPQGQEVGLRSRAEVLERMDALKADAQTDPLDPAEVTALLAILDVSDTAPRALARLREVAKDLPAISAALDVMEARLAALSSNGVDVGNLPFEAAYGRTNMEYYDGFVFGFHADGMPPVATGGRYDALTRVLGQGREIPAVGGVIRPELVEALR